MSTTITEKETSTTTVSPSPLSYTSTSFFKHNNSSNDSLDSQSTIKITSSPSPTPTITNTTTSTTTTTTTTTKPKKISIPNYYVPPKVPIITSQDEPVSPSEYTPLPPKLIRKKSGELVKSSLKLSSLLQRSLSTPQLSSKSAPSTPRKSVRFASRLIKVKMFDGCDSPSAVSSTNCSPCHSPPSYDFEPDFFDADDVYTLIKNRNHSRKRAGFDWNWDKSTASSSSSEDEDEDEYWSTPKTFTNNGSNNSHSNTTFSAPSASREYRLTSHNIPKMVNTKESIVWLPSAYVLKTDGKTFLYGLVNVKNLAFEKKIVVKLTLNNWKTSVVFGGQSIISYVKSIDSIDQFKFKISLDDLIYGSNNVDLQLCIKYEVNGNEYWDNNFGNNYKFKLTRVEKKQALPHHPKVSSTLASLSKKEDDSPQFNELVSKLMLHKDSTKKTAGQRSFSVFNNFEDSSSPAGVRPPLFGKSFSSSDIVNTPRQRYSQRQQRSHRRDTVSTTVTSKSSTANSNPTKLDFSSLSYTDLLNNYCFANNSTTSNSSSTSSTSTPNTPILASCLPPSTASTLHSFSDSIHI